MILERGVLFIFFIINTTPRCSATGKTYGGFNVIMSEVPPLQLARFPESRNIFENEDFDVFSQKKLHV